MNTTGMKQYVLAVMAMLALLPVNTFGASATINIEDFTINGGETKEMLIDVDNAGMQVTMVEFYMRLPDGLSVATEDGELAVDIAGRTTWRKHTLEATVTDDVVHVMLYSGSNAVLSGTSGAVISVKLTAAPGFSGGSITFENQLLTAPDETESKPADFTYTVTMGQAPVLGTLSIEDFTMYGGETKEVLIDVDNADMQVTMVEFFMRLPDGLSVATEDGELAVDIAGRTTWRKHTLEATTTDNVVHVMLYSGSNAVLSGTSGAVISVKLTAASGFSGGYITLENQLLTAPDETESKPSDYIFNVKVGVTLTAKSYTREYGEENPTFEYEETRGTIVSGTPTLTCSATKTSPVGTYDIIISKGTVSNSTVNLVNGTLTINAKNASSLTIGSIAAVTYNGSAQTPAVTVKDGTKTLTVGTDYTVSYSNNTNAGTATVTVTGMGNYTGTKTATFTIKAKNASSLTIGSIAAVTYNGSAQAPAVTVKDGTKTLTVGTDYTVAYSNNTDAGTATVTVTGMGNYTGTKTATFTIKAKNASSLTIGSIAAVTYNGSAQTPAVTVKDGPKTLTSGTDYTVSYSNNTDAGTATVTVTGMGNYTGTKTATFTINAKNASSLTIGSIAAVTYNGSAQTPAVTVKDGTKTLTVGTDYTVSYSNNTDAGTATVTITGMGNYTGTKTATFTIKAKKASSLTIGSIAAVTYTGFVQTPAVTVKDGTKTLTSGTDYTVAYSNNTNAGTATVTVTGMGNYTGTKTATFTINAKNASSLTIGSIADFSYNGSAQAPTVTVKDGTKKLTVGTDYTVAYSNNTNAGTATVTVTGKGNYTGTKTATFTINKAILTISAGDYTRKESEENPTFTPTFSGFVSGETESVLTKQPTVSTTATADSPAGTYPVTVGGAEAQNYSFNYVNGTLNVTPNPEHPVVGSIFDAPMPCGNGTAYLTFKVTSTSPWEVEVQTSPTSISGALTITATVTNEAGLEFTVTSIGSNAFTGCSGLTSVTIPNSVTNIGRGAFEDCSSLNEVHSMIEEPFAIDEDVFTVNGVWTTATLYVLGGTKAKYQVTAGWKNFMKIVQIANPTTDISDSEHLDENENINEVYDLSGRRMPMLVKGINVVRQSDGRIKKVVRK